MKGTIVNAAAIVAGSGLGLFLKRGIPPKVQQTLIQGICLAVFLIGLQMAFKTKNVMILIFSLVIGGVLGEALAIEDRLNKFGDWISKKFKGENSNIGEGFVSASLIYCVGAMAIVGSIQDGLTGDPSTLYAKAILDGVSSIVFASTMGAGVALSAVSVAIYQGILTALAGCLGSGVDETLIAEVTAVGGILIVGISLTILEIKKINVANLLPAIPLAAVITIIWNMHW